MKYAVFVEIRKPGVPKYQSSLEQNFTQSIMVYNSWRSCL